MLSQMDSTLTTLCVILETLEQSASLAEKITQMEEFISTLFSCSTENIGQEMSVNSMWVDATQTLSAAIVHQKKDGTTRRKMVTLWEEDLSDRAEMEYLRLARSGLSLSWQEIETSFLRCARTWLLGHYSVTSLPSAATPIGGSAPILPHTSILSEYFLARNDIHSSILGYNRTWEDLHIPVSNARHSGEASCSFQSPGPRASVGHSFIRGLPIYNYTSLLGANPYCRTTKIISLVRADTYRQNPVGA